MSSEVEKGESIKTAIQFEGLLSHVQTVGKGGLLITLAKLSAHYDLGLKSSIDITNAQLFSETPGRYVVSVKSGKTLNIDNAIEIELNR